MSIKEDIKDLAHDAFVYATDVETTTDEGFRYFLLIVTVFMFGGSAYTAWSIDHNVAWAVVFTVLTILGLAWDAAIFLVHWGVIDIDK